MRPISPTLRKELNDTFQMTSCVCCGSSRNIEFHHVWQYARKQINEVWNVLPLCVRCHRGNNGTITRLAKQKAEKESLIRLVNSGFKNLTKYQKLNDTTWVNRINYYENYIGE